MALDEAGMHRAGLGFLYRIIPVLVATILYGQTSSDGSMLKLTIVPPGIYIAILSIATRGLWRVLRPLTEFISVLDIHLFS